MIPVAAAESSNGAGPEPACLTWSPSHPVPTVDLRTCYEIVAGNVAWALDQAGIDLPVR